MMCWKHEWARAINNLEWAKIHIERAQIKVKKRNRIIATNTCEELIELLKEAQDTLKDLIVMEGISMKEKAPSLEKRMKGSRVKSGQVEAWVKSN